MLKMIEGSHIAWYTETVKIMRFNHFILKLCYGSILIDKRSNLVENIDISKTSRQYKDTLFRALFGDDRRFLELYNAVDDKHFPDDTIVTPCPSNSLLARFNDLAACIGSQLVVFFEHQSSISKNMPLRLLQYATDILYSQIVDMDKLYGSTQIIIPTPKFFILYNGGQKLEGKAVRLSDVFAIKEQEPPMELTAKVIDINYTSGEVALSRSNSLKGYSFLVAQVRKHLNAGKNRDASIVEAIELCIEQDILKDFLRNNYKEVIKMLTYEYDAEAEKRVLLQEGRQEGRQEVLELVSKLLREGLSLEEAYAMAVQSLSTSC